MAINWFAGQTDSPWSNWYMPRPVVTQEDAEEEVAPSEITPVTPYPYPYNMADPHVSGDDDHFSTSIDPVRATRQITDSMMMSLSNIGVNDIEFDSFNSGEFLLFISTIRFPSSRVKIKSGIIVLF